MRHRIDNLQLNDPISQQTQAPSPAPFRWRATGHCNQARLLFPVELPTVLPSGTTPIQGCFQSLQNKALANTFDGGNAHIQRVADIFILLAFVGLEENPSMRQSSRPFRSGVDHVMQHLTLIGIQGDDVVLGHSRLCFGDRITPLPSPIKSRLTDY